ncbi:hypothetical protein [Azospirillum soli]|uniref:hypothetical protein n=1 Tax=Azospirillum soli TaxID=1304799 RepID=UPI001AE6E897|nr:hypothetical protein [Azospirillum soli]MBP2315303.1 DNA repair exonuclease SbcCD ATPase subunit [Azospirillum soli]
MTTSQSLGNDIRLLLDELMDLLDETPVDRKGPIYARIDELHELLDRLIDETIERKKAEYDAAIADLGRANKAIKEARKRVKDLLEALEIVDKAVSAIAGLLKALA